MKSLIGERHTAAAVVTAQTDNISGQGCQLMVCRIRPLAFDGKIIPLVGGGIVVWKMACRTPGAVVGGILLIVLSTHVATGTKFAIQFSGKVIQLRDTFEFKWSTIFGKDLCRACTVKLAVLSFPGFLDVFDHAGVGVHNIGPDPL